MKVLMLAGLNSVHTIKWANALTEKGIEVHVIGLTSYDVNAFNPSVFVYSLDMNSIVEGEEGGLKKIQYIKKIPYIRKKINEIKPDILHAHYGSSYGFLGSLCGFHPFIVSVWGSDVYDFPRTSLFHKLLFKFVLFRADRILSTSNAMAIETSLYTNKEVFITPFGVDLDRFKLLDIEPLYPGSIVIGTIKTLDKIYGIEYLIEAFKIVKQRNSNLLLKLMIVGDGPLKLELIHLAAKLNLSDSVIFTGKVNHNDVPFYHNQIDVFVALSLKESFGVAIVEAQACEKPVVVSNIGGLPEVIEDKLTGFVVPSKDSDSAANAIEKLVLNKDLRVKMGIEGRRRVLEFYEWEKCINIMISIYKNLDFKS